jgi:hypothetical protein
MDFINTLLSNLSPVFSIINFDYFLVWVNSSTKAPLVYHYVVTLLLSGLIAFGLVALNAYKLKKHQTKTKTELTIMREQLYLTNSAMIAMVDRVSKLEENIHTIMNKQIDIETRYPEVRTFSVANDLVKAGATTEDLISEGLNRPEAELFKKLQQSRNSSG